ncbi:MAG: hypothetical protein K6G83_03800 [Lachnospiraceae bacterium]|nr:hypothetical protein [Lachnospiraceae bacterium]
MKKQGIMLAASLLIMSCLSGCYYNLPQAAAEAGTGEAAAQTQEADDTLTVSNGLFSVTLPPEAAGLFVAETTDDGITIYEKEANEAGYGGYAFGIAAYKEPSEYAGGMDMKVGEFTDGDGTLYDIVVQYPSDIQYDYTKYEDVPQNYLLLTDSMEDVAKTVAGADGKGTFVWGGGTKGEDLYPEVLAELVTAITEGYDANRLEEEGMSSMYYAMSTASDGDVLDSVGYAFYDTNHDGVDELLVGEIADGDWKGVVYDIYTMVDREPAHVLSGWDRSRYYALKSGMVINEYSGGAAMSGWDVFDIEPNTTEILPQVSFKVDEYENEDAPWFISYDNGETWESVPEEEFTEFLSRFQDYMRFDYTPLSEFSAAAG